MTTLEIEKKIQYCLSTDKVLDISCMGLVELPSLPEGIEVLMCYKNALIQLPNNLPSSIIIIDCSYNKLTSLPTLPPKLEKLSCNNNYLSSLPILPKTLEKLDGYSNNLTRLPELPVNISEIDVCFNKLTSLPKLPDSLTAFCCEPGKYTYIPQDIVKRFENLEVTLNFPFYMNCFKKIYSSRKRIKRIKLCNELHDQIDEFRYRPSGAGYVELKVKNKSKFADL